MAEKINLLVKKQHGTLSNQIQYQFRLNSYEGLNLDNYRVVAWITTTWCYDDIVIDTQGGQPYSGNSGNPNLSIDLIPFNSAASPPRIYPTDERYNVKVRGRFTVGTGVDGGYWDNISMGIRHSNYKTYLDPNSDVNSYSYQSDTAYGSNATFVLEFNDIDPSDPDSVNWVKVDEVTDNVGTSDPNTGEYPMGDTAKDDTTQEDPITGYKHKLLFSNKDTYIDNVDTATNYGSDTYAEIAGEYYINPSQRVRRGMFDFDIAGSGLTVSNTIITAQAWMYVFSSDLNLQGGDVIDLYSLNASWVENTATWANGASKFGSGISSLTVPTNTADLGDGYGVVSFASSVIDDWISGSVHGLGIRMNNEAQSSRRFRINTKEGSEYDEALVTKADPRIVVVYQESVAPTGRRRIIIT